MTTAEDLRDLRDALDSIAHGALPRWVRMSTKTGEEAQIAARKVYERWFQALMQEGAAKLAVEKATLAEDQHRTHAEVLTAKCEEAERKLDEARAEIERLRARGEMVRGA